MSIMKKSVKFPTVSPNEVFNVLPIAFKLIPVFSHELSKGSANHPNQFLYSSQTKWQFSAYISISRLLRKLIVCN